MRGEACFSSSSCLGPSSALKLVQPVTLALGCARFVVSPQPIGSPVDPMTIGTVAVVRCAATVAFVPDVTITSTLAATSSAASAGSRS